MVEILKLIGHLGYGTFGIFLCENAHKLILNILILIPTQKKNQKNKTTQNICFVSSGDI